MILFAILLGVLYLLVGLPLFFEVYALGKRTGVQPLVWLGYAGLPSDLFAARTWLHWLAPEGRTVTARAEAGANEALAAIRLGVHPSLRTAAALLLASYLNARDPGHCNLTQ